jgi:hypothetical protein
MEDFFYNYYILVIIKMHKRILLFVLVIAIVATILLFVKKRRSKSSKLTSSRFGLSSGAGSKTFDTSNSDAEGKKMTIPLVMKNTIMSLSKLKKIPSRDPTKFIMYGSAISSDGLNNPGIPVKQIMVDKPNDLVIFITQDGQYVKAVAYTGSTGEVKDNRYYTGNISALGSPQQPQWNYGTIGTYNVRLDSVTYNNGYYFFYGPAVTASGNGTILVLRIIIDKINDLVVFAAQDGSTVKAVAYTGSTGIIRDNRSYTGNISTIYTPTQPAWNLGTTTIGYNVRKVIESDRLSADAVKNIFSGEVKDMIKSMYTEYVNSANYYPSIIREGLFYIRLKGTNKYIWKNYFGGLEIKDSPPDFDKFSSRYISGTVNTNEDLPMPFFLKFKEKDESKREYTFYLKSFLGNIEDINYFKNIGQKPFWQAGYNNLMAKFDYGCREDSGEGGFLMSIPLGEKQLYYDVESNMFRNDAISWYSIPAGIKGTAWWGSKKSSWSDGLDPLTTVGLCDQNRNDRWSSLLIEYEYPDRPCLALSDATTDDSPYEYKFIYDENNNLYVKQGDKYLHFWYYKFPGFVDGYDNRHIIELVPVLPADDEDDTSKPKLTRRYYNASLDFLKKNSSLINNFCGTTLTFPDGISKIYQHTSGNLPTNPVEKAFDAVCACKMDASYYFSKLCPDSDIKNTYGLDPANPNDQNNIAAIRDNLKCGIPNCRFSNCRDWYSKRTEAQHDFLQYKLESNYNVTEGCGSGVICINKQDFNIGAGAQVNNSILSADNLQSCGDASKDLLPRTVEEGDVITEGKILKRKAKCIVGKGDDQKELTNITSATRGCYPSGFVTYFDFNNASILENSVSQSGEKVIKIKVSGDKNLTSQDLMNNIEFIKTNVRKL